MFWLGGGKQEVDGKDSGIDGQKISTAHYEVAEQSIKLFPAVSWKADHVLRLLGKF